MTSTLILCHYSIVVKLSSGEISWFLRYSFLINVELGTVLLVFTVGYQFTGQVSESAPCRILTSKPDISLKTSVTKPLALRATTRADLHRTSLRHMATPARGSVRGNCHDCCCAIEYDHLLVRALSPPCLRHLLLLGFV
jgi:hypothetical protein